MTENKFIELVEIIKRLRKECPWDSKQTNDSIKDATLEEAYETVEAIDNKDWEELKFELGDLLLHVIFHSIMADENKYFSLDEVIEGIKDKLIRRHPHVFGDKQVDNDEDVKVNWEAIKKTEGRTKVLDGIPKNLPAIQKSHRLQDKASKAGFNLNSSDDSMSKLIMNLDKITKDFNNKNYDEVEDEVGELFFNLINYFRILKINPENALRGYNDKFIKKVGLIEDKLSEEGKVIYDMKSEELLQMLYSIDIED